MSVNKDIDVDRATKHGDSHMSPTATGRMDRLGFRRVMSEAPHTHGRISSEISPRSIIRRRGMAQSLLEVRRHETAGPCTRSRREAGQASRTMSGSTAGTAPGLTARSLIISSRCDAVGPG